MKKYRAAALFLLAFALRVGYGLRSPGPPTQPDAQTRDVMAWNLASQGRFAGGSNVLTAYSPPSYIVFLAGVFKLAGHRYLAVHMVQALLGAILVFLVIALTRRVTLQPESPWIAGAMAAFYPFC